MSTSTDHKADVIERCRIFPISSLDLNLAAKQITVADYETVLVSRGFTREGAKARSRAIRDQAMEVIRKEDG